jgi:peptidyl-prolyl cis-trans isomerase A (cyclophilin A)
MLRLLFFFILISANTQAHANALFAFVNLETSLGVIRLKLYKKEAPVYVENFVGLASGEKQFRNIKTGKKIKDTAFYQDMIFHKVHPDLGIQTGCPWGNGKGWPGFTVKQEKNELKFDKPYLVSMAAISGDSNSVGSQFFITTKKAPHLDNEYTVMGEVVQGFEIVDQISQVPRDAIMRPLKPIKLIRVTVE